MPAISNENSPENRIFNTDANILAAYIYSDVAYLDPPNDSRQYSDIYHLPENIAMWAQPELKGKAMKNPRGHIKSLYCKKGAEEVFSQLVALCKAKLIIAALPEKQQKRAKRSSSKISGEQMMQIMRKKGRVSVVFPPFSEEKNQTGEQIFLSYEFKKILPSSRENSNLKGGLVVCQCMKMQEKLIDSPINFTGGKYRELEKILPYFPPQCQKFFDIFAGGCSVGINAQAEEIIFIDRDSTVMALFDAMKSYGELFIQEVRQIIEKYAFSRSWEHGYAYYGVTAEEGLANINKEAYINLRTVFNTTTQCKNLHYYAMLYVLLVYGFNQMPRFNRLGEFNLNVGKRDWNIHMQEKLTEFLARLKRKKTIFMPMDFRTIDLSKLSTQDFLYFDPPYMRAETYYNRQLGWSAQDERELMGLLDRLDTYGIRYALSAIQNYSGACDEILEQWLAHGIANHRVIRYDMSNTDKLLILNY